jgi:roadblock/LC7 domain-containing protein
MLWDIPQMVTSVTGIINKFVPDRDQQVKLEADLKLKFAEIEANQLAAQAEINKVEAASSSIFVSGWRPFIGWCCGASILYAYLLNPILTWAMAVAGAKTDLPKLPTEDLFSLTLAMLGLAGYRTYERVRGVAAK